jgi:hypothetical protein
MNIATYIELADGLMTAYDNLEEASEALAEEQTILTNPNHKTTLERILTRIDSMLAEIMDITTELTTERNNI